METWAESGVYDLFMNTDGHLVIDAKGSDWDNITADNLPKTRFGDLFKKGNTVWTTRDVAKYAKRKGYTGVTFKNLVDSGNAKTVKPSTVYVSFDPQAQVKSADAVTYDDGGNVIPLTERFKAENKDIRYSLSAEDGNLGLDKSQDLVYNGRRGDTYVRTDEFRNLQAESQRMSAGEWNSYLRGGANEVVRRRISTVLQRQMDTWRRSGGFNNGVLNLSAKGNQFNIYEEVDPSLFHDVFDITRKHLKNGELVDLHGIETTEEHGIGYKECHNYLSEDGLSGFSITPDGDLISVFNASGKGGFLRAIATIVKERAKTLDCFASPKQNLLEMYQKTFGFKTASVMDYNMEYDHDNIAQNHNNPKVAFMVNTEQDVETRNFTKDQYDEAVAYRNSFVEQATDNTVASFMPKTAENPYSLSDQNATPKKYGNFAISGEDVRLWGEHDISPIAEKPHVSMEEFANSESPVWRNVDYNDDSMKTEIMRETHKNMVAEGAVVTVPEEVSKSVSESFPDLRGMKKKDRTPILKESMRELKESLRQFLNGFKNQGFEFEVNGKILDTKLYTTGINEVLEKITKDKANMLYTTEEVFRNARYLYSTEDYSSDPNVYRWNYFYTPVQIGDNVVGVRLAVRDVMQGQEHLPESQVYNWGIKKDATLGGVQPVVSDLSHGASSDASTDTSLDGGRRGPKVASSDVSSDVSENIIPQLEGIVKTQNWQDVLDDFREPTGADVDKDVEPATKPVDTPVQNATSPIADAPIAEQQNAAIVDPRQIKTENAPVRSNERSAPLPPNMEERSWYETSSKSEAVDGAFTPDDIPNELRYYQVKHNKDTLARANQRLEKLGYKKAVTAFEAEFTDARFAGMVVSTRTPSTSRSKYMVLTVFSSVPSFPLKKKEHVPHVPP